MPYIADFSDRPRLADVARAAVSTAARYLVLALLLTLSLLGGCARAPTEPVTIDLGDTASIVGIAVASDSRTLVIRTAVGLEVWDLWRREMLWERVADGVTAQLGPSGRWMLFGWRDKAWKRYVQIVETRTGEVAAELRGEPVEQWQAMFRLGPRGRHVAAENERMDIALYDLDDFELRKSLPWSPLELQPRLLREGGSWDQGGDRVPQLAFNHDETELIAFSRRRKVMDRWSTAVPPKRLSFAEFGEIGEVYPSGVGGGHRYVWDCAFDDMEIAETQQRRLTRQQRFALPVEHPSGRLGGVRTSTCGVSPDGRHALLGLIGRDGYEIGYALGLWTIDGKLVLQDDGRAEGATQPPPTSEPVVGHAFTADGSMLYVIDRAMGLHIYALQAEPRIARIAFAAYGGDRKAHAGMPLLAPSAHGIAISGLGDQRVYWVPVTPPQPGE